MLSRLISLLSRIPAVKWAFNRLRPLPHSGSLDVAPIAADEEPTLVAAVAPVAGDGTIVSVVEEEASTSPVEVTSETVDAPELISDDPPAELLTNVEPDIIDEAPVADVETVEAPEPVIISDAFLEFPADIEPVVANDLPPVAAVVAEETLADTLIAATDIEPSPAAKSPGAPKARAKVVEPADRAALIRQRWIETGIRMWNPRLHGTGDAALNIQGRIGLLPPEPGETMPRYDKLEFKMLGGQIVCEGVIVEAPVRAGQRSFTRLAEPRGGDRSRGPVRERQAALA